MVEHKTSFRRQSKAVGAVAHLAVLDRLLLMLPASSVVRVLLLQIRALEPSDRSRVPGCSSGSVKPIGNRRCEQHFSKPLVSLGRPRLNSDATNTNRRYSQAATCRFSGQPSAWLPADTCVSSSRVVGILCRSSAR